jgi:hypothetical protein
MFAKKTKTLEGILSSFQTTCDDLSALQVANEQLMESKEIQIKDLTLQVQTLEVETKKAGNVREKLLSLIS